MTGRFETEAPGLTEQALYEIGIERERQFAKWGPQHHPDGTSDSWVDQQTRDLAREVCDLRAARGAVSWADILREEFHEALAEEDRVKLRKELVQVAAVAAAWIEDIDTRG